MQEEPNPQPRAAEAFQDNYVPNLSSRFGQIGDFWKRYDELADRKDREMSRNLNGNLDVLLIFAGLFSAVNTAFISIATSSLSPDPSDKTNALLELLVLRADNRTLIATDLSSPFSPPPPPTIIASNCLLYASLCCSLISAMGAMLAKEWLQSFDRTGHTGTLEEQARFRQLKFNGAQQWHLETVVLLLPSLLLLSVSLFFAGLALYLLPVNLVVAGIVIAFGGAGVLLGAFTVTAGALSPLCPYQTAVSVGLRRVVLYAFPILKILPTALKRLWIGRVYSNVFRPVIAVCSPRTAALLSRFPLGMTEGGTGDSRSPVSTAFPTRSKHGDHRDHVLNAQAAKWLLKMTSNLEDQITVAQNVCCLDPAAASHIMLHDPMTWRHLLALTQDAIRLWHDCPTTINKRRAERFGAAICYLLLRQPEYGEKWGQVRSAFPSDAFWRPELPSWLRLDVLETLLTGKVPNRGYCVALMGPEQSLNKIVLRKVIASFGRATSESVGWADLVRLVRIPYDDTTLSLLSLYIRQIFEFLSEEPRWASGMEDPRTQALASDEYLGDRVGLNIANALWAWETLAKVVTDPAKLSDMAEIYISFMRRIEDLASRIQADRTLVQFMRRGLEKIVLSIGKRRIRDSVTYVRLVLGSISLAKALYLDGDSLEPLTEIGLWSSLEYVAWVARDNSGMTRKLRLEDFMIKALGWVAMNFRTQAKIQKLPNLVAFLASRLSSNDAYQKARWLLVYCLGDKWRFADGHDASILWIKTGLSAQLIDCLGQRTDETRSSLLRLLTDLSKSSVWACRLVDDGFVKAMAGLINDLTPPHENCWTPLHDLATEALLSVWRSSSKTRLSYWAVDKMLVAIGRLLAFANIEQERRELGEILLSVSIPFDDLLELVRSLAAHRGIHAFVARNVDVLINSIGTGFGRGPNWEYSGYCDSGSVELCSRSQLTGAGLL